MTTSPTTEELIEMWSGAILYGHNVSDHLKKLHEENKRLRDTVSAGIKYCEALCGVGLQEYLGDEERLFRERTVSHETLDELFDDWAEKSNLEQAFSPTPQSQEDVG